MIEILAEKNVKTVKETTGDLTLQANVETEVDVVKGILGGTVMKGSSQIANFSREANGWFSLQMPRSESGTLADLTDICTAIPAFFDHIINPA